MQLFCLVHNLSPPPPHTTDKYKLYQYMGDSKLYYIPICLNQEYVYIHVPGYFFYISKTKYSTWQCTNKMSTKSWYWPSSGECGGTPASLTAVTVGCSVSMVTGGASMDGGVSTCRVGVSMDIWKPCGKSQIHFQNDTASVKQRNPKVWYWKLFDIFTHRETVIA